MQVLEPHAMAASGSAAVLTETDPRLKLTLAVGLGLTLWYGGPWGLALAGALLVAALGLLAGQDRLRLQALAVAALFALGWTVVAWGLGVWEGRAVMAALQQAGVLGLRLLLLLLLGLALALGSSARQLGLGLAWFLRPLLGRRAWQVALAVSLMLQFLPRTLETLVQVQRMDKLRAPERRLWQRWALMAQTVLRVLSQNTWKQTVALAARGLDTPEAWQPAFTPQPWRWLVGLGLLAVCVWGAAL